MLYKGKCVCVCVSLLLFTSGNDKNMQTVKSLVDNLFISRSFVQPSSHPSSRFPFCSRKFLLLRSDRVEINSSSSLQQCPPALFACLYIKISASPQSWIESLLPVPLLAVADAWSRETGKQANKQWWRKGLQTLWSGMWASKQVCMCLYGQVSSNWNE